MRYRNLRYWLLAATCLVILTLFGWTTLRPAEPATMPTTNYQDMIGMTSEGMCQQYGEPAESIAVDGIESWHYAEFNVQFTPEGRVTSVTEWKTGQHFFTP